MSLSQQPSHHHHTTTAHCSPKIPPEPKTQIKKLKKKKKPSNPPKTQQTHSKNNPSPPLPTTLTQTNQSKSNPNPIKIQQSKSIAPQTITPQHPKPSESKHRNLTIGIHSPATIAPQHPKPLESIAPQTTHTPQPTIGSTPEKSQPIISELGLPIIGGEVERLYQRTTPPNHQAHDVAKSTLPPNPHQTVVPNGTSQLKHRSI